MNQQDQAGISDELPQPASGPMDQATAAWYVQYTDGQFQSFQRDEHWYLYLPDPDGSTVESGEGQR